MEDVFIFFALMLMMGLLVAVLYKGRVIIKRNLQRPSWEPDRKTVLRRRMEDSQAEIEWITENETQKGGDTG